MKTTETAPALILLLFCSWVGAAVQLNGAGASFPYDVYSAWMPAYKAYRASYLTINMKYESIGSGGGKARIKGDTGPPVAYAGSDSLLKEEEYDLHPDLQMFPSIAGAIVMAYYIPGLAGLNLTMANIVGIYNGSIRYWNHTSLADSNPGTTLPNERVHVAARRDRSGTTEIFTAALSAYDENWRNTYGTFSYGLREDDTPYFWDRNVVTLYGQTNRGVSGLVLSTKFSIGYLVQSDAVTAKLPYARLRNSAGSLVEANAASVQSAMDDFADMFTPRMTVSLANPPGLLSYPISGFTYLIVRRSTMTDCAVARELVRYVEWFYTQSLPRTECENLYMVPLSEAVYTIVIDDILKRMTCQGSNVYSMVLADKDYEQLLAQSWRLPVYISTPIVGVLFIALVLYLVRDQLRLNQALLKNEWKINPDDILMVDNKSQNFGSRAAFSGSRNKVAPSMSTMDSTQHVQLSAHVPGLRLGKFRSELVLLSEQYVLSRTVNLRMKRGILWMRDQVRHSNISEFYGLYLQDGIFSTVSKFCSKGDLQNLLHGTKYNIDTNFKFALSLGVARGMDYLHSQKMVHASLTSSKIFIDDRWSVRARALRSPIDADETVTQERIAGWEAHKLASYQGKSAVTTDMEVTEWAKEEFWIAPEVLMHKSLPTMASDVYSFAIVMQEIFSRDIPYSEQSLFQSPRDALEQVVCASLRPSFTPDTPLEAREIMQQAWEMDPVGRPSFHQIVGMIRRACPKVRSVMDSMLNSLSEYVTQLEESNEATLRMLEDKPIADQGGDIDGGSKKVSGGNSATNQRLRSLPPHILKALGHREPETQLFESVSVLVTCVHGMDRLVRVSTPQEMTDLLSDLYQAMDVLLDSRKDVLKVEVINDVHTLVAGLPNRTSDHLQVMASLALAILSMARTFSIRHRREDSLRMGVGLGTGTAVAGLVGTKVCRFAVFGEALMRAQNMMVTGLPMGIQLKEVTHSLLTHLKMFICVERKRPQQQQETRGHMEKTYWLIGTKDMTETFVPESG
ncbi:hypothetical protein BaRGS_00016567 [Batillaria attramentaria]|uniref:guanylate cyclase n=1 Tax=Batillaria attramentaria TaxID=370345 RepID=A0ABD0KYT1_9CAEN